jgi:hypothetical protein
VNFGAPYSYRVILSEAKDLAGAWLEPFPGKILRFAQDDT